MKNQNSSSRIPQFAATFVLACAVLFGATAQAQSSRQQYKVQVPYAFQVADSKLPAGEYIVELTSHFMLVRGTHSNASASTVALPDYSRNANRATSGPALLFHSYGAEKFVSGVSYGAGAQGREVPVSKTESELSKQSKRAEETLALLKAR